MFGIGETELLIIVAFGFMIFGPDKLPGMGRTIGRALRQFRQAQEGFTEVVQTEVMDPLQDAMNDPLEGGTRAKRRATAEERAAALAQDADIDAPAGESAPRKETFAERKARLAAEREAREAEELARAQAADGDAPEAADVASAADADAAQDAPAPAVEEAAKPAAPDTSAAALYSMGGRSSFAAAKQQAAQEAAEKEAAEAAAAATEAATEEAADAPADAAVTAPEPEAPAASDDGKEAESVEA